MFQQPSDVHFATVSLSTDVTLHYAERGDRKGEAIVFLHAYTDSWFAFSRVLHLLSPSYHALALDERGHGDSDKPECCYTVDDFTADVDAFMDEVGMEEATLVGDSSGGLIAQRVALEYPHRVSRLVLIPDGFANNVVEQRGRNGGRGKDACAGRSHLARVHQGVPYEHDPPPGS